MDVLDYQLKEMTSWRAATVEKERCTIARRAERTSIDATHPPRRDRPRRGTPKHVD
jgi:hypothetical protein